MDEPTMGLDAISKRELFAELLALMGDEEHTVLISSHNLTDLERFADHIGIINEGKLLLEGATDNLLEETPADQLHARRRAARRRPLRRARGR